jgi:hypothetical protein
MHNRCAIDAQSLRSNCAITVQSLRNHCAITPHTMPLSRCTIATSRCETASKSLASQSILNRCANAVELLCNHCTIAPQSLRNCRTNAAQTPRRRYEIAAQMLLNRGAIAVHPLRIYLKIAGKSNLPIICVICEDPDCCTFSAAWTCLIKAICAWVREAVRSGAGKE